MPWFAKKPSITWISRLGPRHLGILCTASCTWPCKQLRIQDTSMNFWQVTLASETKKRYVNTGMAGYQMIRSTCKMLSENYASIIHQSILQEHHYTTPCEKPKVQIFWRLDVTIRHYDYCPSLSWGNQFGYTRTQTHGYVDFTFNQFYWAPCIIMSGWP